jgi:ankyrin repeat protein
MYETPLYLAALEGQDKAVSLLLDNGALVNTTDSFMNTPLHAAAMRGHVGVAALLLERGANQFQVNDVRTCCGQRWQQQRGLA